MVKHFISNEEVYCTSYITMIHKVYVIIVAEREWPVQKKWTGRNEWHTRASTRGLSNTNQPNYWLAVGGQLALNSSRGACWLPDTQRCWPMTLSILAWPLVCFRCLPEWGARFVKCQARRVSHVVMIDVRRAGDWSCMFYHELTRPCFETLQRLWEEHCFRWFQ